MSKVIHKKNHWTSKVNECALCKDTRGDSNVRLLGGAEHGLFAYVGPVDEDIVVYKHGKLIEGELLLEVENLSISGLPLYDVHTVIRNCKGPVRLKTVRQDLSISIVVPFSVYGDRMVGCDSLKVSAIATVPIVTTCYTELRVYKKDEDIVLEDPPISISVLDEVKQFSLMTAAISFTNPLDRTLKNCTLTVSGSGLLRQNIQQSLPDLQPGHQLRCHIPVFPYKAGKKTLLVDFDCSTFRDIKASCPVDVKPYVFIHTYQL